MSSKSISAGQAMLTGFLRWLDQLPNITEVTMTQKGYTKT